MNEKFSYYKLLKSQWSWDNSIPVFDISAMLSTLMVFIGYMTEVITVDPPESTLMGYLIVWIIIQTYLLVCYSIFKFMLLGVVYCGLVTYFANRGSKEAISNYKEALIWRKK